MHDYTVSDPDCTPSTNYLHSDCGSQGWAFALFISWNVISMYIFLNSKSQSSARKRSTELTYCLLWPM